jgi:hypothetical protein
MIKLFSKGHKHEHVTVNIGQPPERALFKVKSRTYLASQARCKILHHLQTRIRLVWEELYSGCSHISPHLEFALLSNKTQVCGDQVSFVNVPSPKSYQSVVVDEAHMFLGIICPPFFSISAWKVGDQKYPKDNLLKNMFLLLFEKGNKSYANPGYLLVVLCLLRSWARLGEFHLAAIIGGVIPVSPPILDVSVKL